MNCFYEWNGYYYKDNPLNNDDDLRGLKNIIKNFMFNDKMREVVNPLEALNYDYIDFP